MFNFFIVNKYCKKLANTPTAVSLFWQTHCSFRSNTEQNKKIKVEIPTQLDESSDKTLFSLLHLPNKPAEIPAAEVDTDKLSTFSNLLQKFTADHTVVKVSTFTLHTNKKSHKTGNICVSF